MYPKDCCAKWEFVGQLFFVGARDFSPSSLEFSGLKSRAPKDLSPLQIALADKEGSRLQNGVDNAVNCENFGTHVGEKVGKKLLIFINRLTFFY